MKLIECIDWQATISDLEMELGPPQMDVKPQSARVMFESKLQSIAVAHAPPRQFLLTVCVLHPFTQIQQQCLHEEALASQSQSCVTYDHKNPSSLHHGDKSTSRPTKHVRPDLA